MKKLYILNIASECDENLMNTTVSSISNSNLNKYFNIVFIIVTPNEQLKNKCLSKINNKTFQINILIDSNSRINRTEAIRQVLLKMPLNSLIWSIPEGIKVNPNAGELLSNITNNDQIVEFSLGNQLKGIDHLILYRPPEGLINNPTNTEVLFENQRMNGLEIPLSTVYETSEDQNEIEKICTIYPATDNYKNFFNHFYEPIFSQTRSQKIKLLKVGLENSSLLKVLRDYFYDATVLGLDSNLDFSFKENRINTFIGDSTAKETAHNVLQLNRGSFNLIIDNKNSNSQLETFKNLWPNLEQRGLYFIENPVNIEELEDGIKSYDPDIKYVIKNVEKDNGAVKSKILCIFKL